MLKYVSVFFNWLFSQTVLTLSHRLVGLGNTHSSPIVLEGGNLRSGVLDEVAGVRLFLF